VEEASLPDIVVSSIDSDDDAAVGMTELKPRRGAASNTNIVVLVRLKLTLRDFTGSLVIHAH
jgi:hypothetical protein